MIPPHNSLVRYDNAILINSTKDSGKQGQKPTKANGKQLTPTEDILNSILPPREWTEDGFLWVQYVSSTPATRSDVIALQANLDTKLQQRQARETGICPIREELYAQCFDELIRQVTINCAERGLLLLRVRDEIRMTVASYQTLYESSIAFGMRKALQAEQAKQDMQNKMRALDIEKKDLEKQLQETKLKCEQAEKRDFDRRLEEEKKHKEEVDRDKEYIRRQKKELEQILSIPSAQATAATPMAANASKVSASQADKSEKASIN